MQKTRPLISILFILIHQVAFNQQNKVYKRYYSVGSFPKGAATLRLASKGAETLTLASNGIYYHSYSVESKAFVSKGRWKESGGELQLRAFAARKVYPKPVFEIKKGNDSNFTISVKDVFDQPYKGFGIALIRADDPGMEHPEYEFLGSSGTVILRKNDYLGFYLLYQYGDSEAKKYDNDVTVHAFDQQMDEINITIAFDGCAPLDRGINFSDYSSLSYHIKNDGLYKKHNLVFKQVSLECAHQ